MAKHLRRLGFFLVFGLLSAAQAASVGSFTNAQQQGAFTVGTAQASLSYEPSASSVGPTFSAVDYVLPAQTAAGVWAKEYPATVSIADAVQLKLDATAETAASLALALEIKGSSGVQRIPVALRAGRTVVRERIDWSVVGGLSETVLVLQRTGGTDPAVGRVQFELTFRQLSAWQRWRATLWGRLGSVALFSLLLSLPAALFRYRRRLALSGLTRDLALGGAAALIAASAQGVWMLGRMSPLDSGRFCLLVAAAGALIHGLLRPALTGRTLSAGELLRSALFPGLLAAAAGREEVWQAPATLTGLFELSGFGAALFVVLFHIAAIGGLLLRRKTPGWIGSSLLVAIPFVFGLPLALQSASSFAVRALLIFCAGEFVANAASLIRRERPCFSLKIHRALLVLSVLTVVAPHLADFGSGSTVAAWPTPWRSVAAIVTVMLSQGPLWALVYLLTGLVLGTLHGNPPSGAVAQEETLRGFKKGAVFGGVAMGLLQMFRLLADAPWMHSLYSDFAPLLLVLAGVLLFPLLKTVIETFDGSLSFFGRLRAACCDPTLLVRGLLLGGAVSAGLALNLPELPVSQRAAFGAVAGAVVFGGVSLLRDGVLGLFRIGGIKTWRWYLVESGLGALIGAGIGFYLDAAQLPILAVKFDLYTSFGIDPAELTARCQQVRTTAPDSFTALISRWGHIRLLPASGGAKMLFNEALMGVIGWGIAAPLFAINKAALAALLNRDFSLVKRLPTRAGLVDLADGTVYVLRWGLWMAPLIFTFLRPMAEATWYNQDGLFRTLCAVFQFCTLEAGAFTDWSLTVFSWIIGYAAFQVLIWMDHMGLRVATLVNLSFLGADRLDERCATFVGSQATARFIPEGVKRFATWAPLLIPFYLPKGEQWEQVFRAGAAIQARRAGALLGWKDLLLTATATALGVAVACAWRRRRRERRPGPADETFRLLNNRYELELCTSGELVSWLAFSGAGISRCSFEKIDPAGRILFVVETDAEGRALRSWPVLGNFPKQQFTPSAFECDGDRLRIVNIAHEVCATVTITLPSRNDPAELWTVELEDLSGRPRHLKLVPYLEWMLSRPEVDRNHTQYNRLYPEISYRADTNALLAFHRVTRLCGLLASETAPVGLLTGRIDFIGRAGNVWTPRALETLAFRPPLDSSPCPSFDPIGALLLDAPVPSGGRVTHRLLIGGCGSAVAAGQLIRKHLHPQCAPAPAVQIPAPDTPRIGHGEIPPGTPRPYTAYADGGNTLRVFTPFTPRPFDHEMANPLGHVVAVTNRGLHCSASGNAQQNRLTPDRADLVGAQLPSEAIYLYDEDSGEWFSPCYEPLKDATAKHEARFSLDGSAVFTMSKNGLATELSVHVPLNEPAGVYLLKLRNTGTTARRLRVVPWFQIALAHSPEQAGALNITHSSCGALFFENPRNRFRVGTCFVAMSRPAAQVVTRRDAFFGEGRPFSRPWFVETGTPAPDSGDAFPVAALLTRLELLPGGEQSLSIVLGEADTRAQATACARKFQSPETAAHSLQATRDWWMALQSTLKIETSDPEFDAYVKWMKYQTLSERLWARKGFYQASGAFGYRDQLQDAVNLIWVDPSLARSQLLLHAAQQFPEGDTAHWFFLRQDGRTDFLSRSHASDNLLWLAWGVVEYLRMTGDDSLLDESVSYLKAETPLPPLPGGKQGMGFYPLRSPRSDSVYHHVLRAVRLVLIRRIGRHGLPLIGTGDWNDGFDEIGSQGRGESVWLALFLIHILDGLLPVIEARDGIARRKRYEQRRAALCAAVETCWRGDRYLRAIHDDGTEIGAPGAACWETDALGAAWAVLAGVNPERAQVALDTALRLLEREKVICLGWPALRADFQPALGRSSAYPEGVRENGMYAHGVQWLIRACRLLAEDATARGDLATASRRRADAVRLWYKISALPHTRADEIELYGGQPNQQFADCLTVHDPGRMIWSGYTGAAGWMLRQACEGVLGATLQANQVVLPADFAEPRGDLTVRRLRRNLAKSPFRSL